MVKGKKTSDEKDENTEESSRELTPLPPPPNIFQHFTEQGDVSEFSQVLNSFYTADGNMDLKSEFHNPRAIAVLDVFIKFIESLGLHDLANLWKIFRKTYVNAMVSYKRGGRKEMVEIVNEFKDKLIEKEVAWD